MWHKRFQIIIANLLVMATLSSQATPSFAQTVGENDEPVMATGTITETQRDSTWMMPLEIEETPVTESSPKLSLNEPVIEDETNINPEVTKQYLFLPLVAGGSDSAVAVEASATTAYWRTIMTEGFEGVWPNGNWRTYDCNGGNYGEQFWNDVSYRSYSGSWSAWPAGGGLNAQSPYNTNYPINACAWMIYGPFSLTGAQNAYFSFRYWNQSESNFDYLGWYYWCSNTSGLVGSQHSGTTNSWPKREVLLYNCLGNSTVYIGFKFTSDASVTYKGPFVDDVKLEVYR